MKKALSASFGVALLAGALPSAASAHTAQVICDRDTGRYVVTPDWLHLSPVSTFGDTSVTVRWTDGFTVVKQLPAPCEPPVPTTPEVVPDTNIEPLPTKSPATPIVTPPVKVAPTCNDLLDKYPGAGINRRRDWGCIILPPPDRPKRKVSKRYYPCKAVGSRSRVVITVTLPNGKVGKVTRYGKRCKSPAVTG